MATGVSGYFDIAAEKGFTARIHYAETYDVASNKSTVSISKVQLRSASGAWGYYGWQFYPDGTIKIGGQTAMDATSAIPTHEVDVQSTDTWYDVRGSYKSVSVAHNNDGSGSVTISVSLKWYTVNGGRESGWSTADSKTIKLTTIPRATTPALSASPVCGGTVTITMKRAVGSFTHRLRYSIAGHTGTLGTGLATSYSWKVSMDMAKWFPAAASTKGTLYCDTYSGSTLIGTKSVEFTLSVPNNSTTRPTLAPVTAPVSSLPEAFAGMYIQGKTGLSLAFHPGSVYSTVKTCTLTIGGKTYTGETVTVPVLNQSGTITGTCTVTDARGFKASKDLSLTVVPYSVPKAKGVECFRCDTGGTKQDGGIHLFLRFTPEIASLDGKNSFQAFYQAGQPGYLGARTAVEAGDNVLANALPDPEAVYQAKLILRDSLGEEWSTTFDLPSRFHTIHLMAGGRGIALGKHADQEGVTVNMDAYFLKKVFLGEQELPSLLFVDSVGSNWIRYKNGVQKVWGRLTIRPEGYVADYAEGAAWGSMYQKQYPVNVTFPVAFLERPGVQLTADDNSNFNLFGQTTVTKTGITSTTGLRPVKEFYPVTVTYEAYGKWK